MDRDPYAYLALGVGDYSVSAYAHPEDLFHEAEQRVPGLVLLDMKMGEFKGDKVLEQLLARWPNLRVIIVTGYPSLEDMRATFKLRVFDYLSKPFSLNQLRQTLKNAIGTYGLGRTDQDRLRERFGHPVKVLRAERARPLKGSCQPNPAERLTDQLDRARRESPQHGKPVGDLTSP